MNNGSPVHREFAFNVEKVVVHHCNREAFELAVSVLKLKGNWKRRSEKVQEMRIYREDTIMFALSTLF